MKKTRKKSSLSLITRSVFSAREKINYANPIPSREFILKFLEEEGEPVSRETIASALHLILMNKKKPTSAA